MSWTRVIHAGRKWQRASNHMDARHCPHCGASVHGKDGQDAHETHHLEQIEHEERLAATIEELCKRVGITEEMVDLPWTWTAVVQPDNEREAING